MEKRKWLLMKAIEYNWDEMGPGDWESIEWLIFSDGSYEMVSKFNTYEETGNKTVGQMNEKVFDHVRPIFEMKWRTRAFSRVSTGNSDILSSCDMNDEQERSVYREIWTSF